MKDLGIGLYFSTLWAIAILMFLDGLLNMPNFIYFSSRDDNVGVLQQSRSSYFAPGICNLCQLLLGPLPGVWSNTSDVEFGSIQKHANLTNRGASTTFALKNNCKGATYEQAFFQLCNNIFDYLWVFWAEYVSSKNGSCLWQRWTNGPALFNCCWKPTRWCCWSQGMESISTIPLRVLML